VKVTKPLDLTLTDSNVAESAYDEWNIATAYDAGDKVKYDPTSSLVYHEFEALSTHTGTTPAIGGGIDWLDLGPANARAMFDSKTGSQTLIDEKLVFTVIPGAFFTTVALLNITGAHSANVLIEYGGATLYDETFDISGNAEDWDQYFFGEDEDNLAALSVVPGIFGDDTPGRASLILDPAIFYATATVTITITGSAGTDVGLGLVLIGRSRYLGDTLYAPTIGIQDFSSKETDAFGNTYLLERPYADTVTAQMILDSVQVDAVRRGLAKYRATPVLYDLNNTASNYESLLVFGFFESFEISLALASKSYCDLRVQSLI
jgi:hypothetical protein